MDTLLVTGGNGLVGNAIKKYYPTAVFVSSKEFNLIKETHVDEMFKTYKPSHVLHLAGKVGGVGINTKHPVEFFEENILINTLVLKYAHKYAVKKLAAFMSTCIFPDKVEYPLSPEKIHLGEPHDSNFGYAYAKRMLDVQIRAYQKEYSKNWFTVIPTNIYGPHDNFHLENAHVIPALIHKCYLAKKNNTVLEIWGSGNAIREFIHVDDVAKLTLKLLEIYDELSPIIVSTHEQVSIKNVVELIASSMSFTGKIIYNLDKPEGQYRKPSDISKLLKYIPNYNFIHIENGISTTVDWFEKNYSIIREN
jgi:GDP-L-fucose synthase